MMRFAVFAAALAFATPALAAGPHQGHGGGHEGMHDMTIGLSIEDGAVLTAAPKEIRLDFKPAMRLASVRLTTATGERVPVTFDSSKPVETAIVSFAPLTPESYEFSFSADAGDHEMPGRIRFTVR